jgi:prepilin-type N-terminal cleavage/methylation domain-containing protein
MWSVETEKHTMRIQTNRTKEGWTLIEIMIAVSLIGLLAGISVPSMFKARDVTALNTIYANLRLIDDVKEQWALERAGNGSNPTEVDLQVYFKGNAMPRPVIGEIYHINDVGQPASAIIPVAIGNLPANSVITL